MVRSGTNEKQQSRPFIGTYMSFITRTLYYCLATSSKHDCHLIIVANFIYKFIYVDI
jgi:hypothetical protein